VVPVWQDFLTIAYFACCLLLAAFLVPMRLFPACRKYPSDDQLREIAKALLQRIATAQQWSLDRSLLPSAH
jgi:hypothetical protein